MKAYWFDNLPGEGREQGDQRAPHDSGRSVDAAYLAELGIIHHALPDDLAGVDALAAAREYKNRDEIEISPATLPGYEEKVRSFFHEHLHEDEEIRYILAGGGYFDVRGKTDDWVRIRLERGDLMIMPAGIYHRFTTDEQNYTKALRLFKDEPKWTPLKRGADTDENPFRKDYLKTRDGALDSVPVEQRMT